MPISAAKFADRRSGYTLAELIVVLVIIGLTLAFVAPRLISSSDLSQVRSAATTIEQAARMARTQARLTGRETRLVIDVDQLHITIEPDGQEFALPTDVSISAIVAEAELDNELAGVRFFADGGATGGTYSLSLEDAAIDVSIDWITGLARRGNPDEGA